MPHSLLGNAACGRLSVVGHVENRIAAQPFYHGQNLFELAYGGPRLGILPVSEKIYEEEVTGTLEIRQLFKFSKVGMIAGCHVLSGVVKINDKARVVRDGIVIYNGSIKTLQHEKDSVKEISKDHDCGLTLENFQDYKEKDLIEVYKLVEVKR